MARPPTGLKLKRALQAEARRLGFHALGISRAGPLDRERERLKAWLDQGMHGTMAWMERNFEKRTDPRELVPGARAVVSVLENYSRSEAHLDRDDVGRISRYAWGDDYHDVMKRRLRHLLAWLDNEVGGANGRVFVDSAPVMDKAWAARSGLGWIGKHTNLINERAGSWFFIGELIVDVDLDPDLPVQDRCGSCTRCIEACPTDAIVQPYVLDARRCISYLTIEHREDDIDPVVAGDMGSWIFGCDICQDVCPWNKFATNDENPAYAPRPGTIDTPLDEWSDMTREDFEERFGGSPVDRARWSGFQRNVRIAGANSAGSDTQNGTNDDKNESTSGRT